MIASGKIKIKQDKNGTKTLIVVTDPPAPNVEFENPPDWVWDMVKGNAKCDVTIDYLEGPPVVINTVTVS